MAKVALFWVIKWTCFKLTKTVIISDTLNINN